MYYNICLYVLKNIIICIIYIRYNDLSPMFAYVNKTNKNGYIDHNSQDRRVRGYGIPTRIIDKYL